MRHVFDIALTGLAAVRLHALRSAVSVSALVVVLTPYLVGLGLAKGIEAEAEASARLGADLYVTGNQFGRSAPVPLEIAERIRQLDGVAHVAPRIVGEVFLGKERVPAVLVGMPDDRLAAGLNLVEGRLPVAGSTNELVVGTILARRLRLKVGSMLPPFYRNDREGERVSQVVGIFAAENPLWQAQLILTTFDTAAAVFEQPGLATDVLVWRRPGDDADVQRRIVQNIAWSPPGSQSVIRPRVTTREDLLALMPRGVLQREGVFNLHFVLVFVVGILVLLVTSGLGLSERRREIGILKATGWQTDEILLRGFVESCALSLAAASLALLLAWVWLRLLNGFGVAAFFIAGVGAAPEFPVPFRLTPAPALLGFLLSLMIVLCGTLYSSWRAAIVPPREAMRH